VTDQLREMLKEKGIALSSGLLFTHSDTKLTPTDLGYSSWEALNEQEKSYVCSFGYDSLNIVFVKEDDINCLIFISLPENDEPVTNDMYYLRDSIISAIECIPGVVRLSSSD
jgi:hypothetical protein